MQCCVTALLENFEFSLPPDADKTKLYRKPAAVMVPMIDDHSSTWMGLKVTSV